MSLERQSFEPGIYFGLPEHVYHAAEGLSCSGMKQLAISPLHYWHNNLNPDRERPEETYPQRVGKAMHCRLLEPDSFGDRYATKLCEDDHPGALVTMDDLKAWLTENGLPTSGKKKQDLIDRIKGSALPAVIWDDLVVRYEEETAGMVLLGKAEAALIEKAAAVAEADQYVKTSLSGGVGEVSFFVRDPETGVMLKARMDYVKPAATIDLKTFSNSRGKPTDRVVFDAIYYEGYYLQCVVYHKVRELARQALVSGELACHGNVSEAWLKGFTETERHGFGFVFIESSEPFDMRIVQLKQAEAPGADSNVYWSAAEMKMADLTTLYAECVEKYGTEPWRDPCKPHVLSDTDMPQLLFN